MGGRRHRGVECQVYRLSENVLGPYAISVVLAAPAGRLAQNALRNGIVDAMLGEVVGSGGKSQHGVQHNAHLHALGGQGIWPAHGTHCALRRA